MSGEDLQAAVDKRPFTPLRLYVSDGATFDVRHPELIMLGGRSLIVGVSADPGQKVFDRAATIDLIHVTRLELLDPANIPGNGPGQ